jgi:hypothetical protein
MGVPSEPQPVKLFVALLSGQADLFLEAERELAALFGSVDSASASLPWSLTDYYEKEMGSGLLRGFVSFFPLVPPGEIAQIKLRTQDLEARYQWREGERLGRRINIDPGYLDRGKVVLTSTKGVAHRIYLGSGIYAEATLLYRKGSFEPFPYTYPDYLWPETLAFFAELRARYLKQLKQA